MSLVRGSQLNFNFVATLFLDVLEQQIEPSRPWLDPLFVTQDKVAEPENSRVSRDQSLNPRGRSSLEMVGLSHSQHQIITDAARMLPVEKRDLYLQRIAAMLTLRGRGHSFVRALHKIN
jgi:hypothetical protein